MNSILCNKKIKIRKNNMIILKNMLYLIIIQNRRNIYKNRIKKEIKT